VVYFIATIGAMFTTLYSVKVLYLAFLTNPNGPIVNYKHALTHSSTQVKIRKIIKDLKVYEEMMEYNKRRIDDIVTEIYYFRDMYLSFLDD
jgi:hypothetical protein